MSHNTYDDNEIVNSSSNLHMDDLLAIRLSRRQTLKGGIGLTASTLLGGLSLTACGGVSSSGLNLGFAAVAKNKLDVVTVPEGYQVSILHALGDPMMFGDESWKDNGSETAESYNRRIGDGHDGMYYFGMADAGTYQAERSDRGLLCVNHEYVVQPYALHSNGITAGATRVAAEVEKEILESDVDGVHFDLIRGKISNIDSLKNTNKTISIGIIDGRNIWKSDVNKKIEQVTEYSKNIKNLWVSSSCPLLHTPYDLGLETKVPEKIRKWLSFSKQKLIELNHIKISLNKGNNEIKNYLDENKKDITSRATSELIHDDKVKQRAKNITTQILNRKSNFVKRSEIQTKVFKLPLYPTTTIGSFPQTSDVRNARAKFKKNELSLKEYEDFLKVKTIDAIKKQEQIDIDVIVHGEFERNDMVEYFGEQLKGFTFTSSGWVQSYGSRCVKPPIIFGDVSRPESMTVQWSKFAQQQTKKIVKGMLTGPITILQWSFVRDDQPRKDTALQIAFAIRDEVEDLENNSIKMIQIDEPALREGLPLKKSDWKQYLDWAVKAFQISAAVAKDETQIHTHMCYAEFEDIIDAIAALDADVISIETSRSRMELLKTFEKFKYPNEVGPGVYDIHSPRVPNKNEMKELIQKASKLIDKKRIWVNPDCGLKTRGWPETIAALETMVQAAKELRTEK